jgi:uncharacterized protein (DUF169 family)
MPPLETYHELGRSLTEQLHLQTFPLAVKLVKREDKMPEKTRRPSVLNMRITMCQGYTMSRRIGWTIGLTAADMKCTPNLVVYGFAEVKDPAAFVEAFRAMDYYKTDEAASCMFATMPRLKARQYAGVVISPLAWTKVEPDLVLVYGNGAQIMRLIQAAAYNSGEPVVTPQAGIAASCAGGALRAFLTKKPHVVVPGGGDRVYAATQDDEIVFACPQETLEDTVASLQKAGYAAGMRYPLPIQLAEPMMVPDAWKVLEGKLKGGSPPK